MKTAFPDTFQNPSLPLDTEIRMLIARALSEDHVHCDITSLACIPDFAATDAQLLLKEDALIAGLHFLPLLCAAVDPGLVLESLATDGQKCCDGTILATLHGNARSLLALERTALNFLQHASGIATLTSRYVLATQEYCCDILDTRKTLPSLRALQKYAVRIGGGKNHRFDLEEQFLIKNNHLKLLAQTTNRPIHDAVSRAKAFDPKRPIEIEVESLAMLEEALETKADRILLDNMSPALVAAAVKIAENKVYLEASGGITLANVAAYAATGVDGISVGALTHSVKAIDISLRIHP